VYDFAANFGRWSVTRTFDLKEGGDLPRVRSTFSAML